MILAVVRAYARDRSRAACCDRPSTTRWRGNNGALVLEPWIGQVEKLRILFRPRCAPLLNFRCAAETIPYWFQPQRERLARRERHPQPPDSPRFHLQDLHRPREQLIRLASAALLHDRPDGAVVGRQEPLRHPLPLPPMPQLHCRSPNESIRASGIETPEPANRLPALLFPALAKTAQGRLQTCPARSKCGQARRQAHSYRGLSSTSCSAIMAARVCSPATASCCAKASAASRLSGSCCAACSKTVKDSWCSPFSMC